MTDNYFKLRDQQTETALKLDGLISDLQSAHEEDDWTSAQTYWKKLQTEFAGYTAKNKELVDLNKDQSLNERSYFKNTEYNNYATRFNECKKIIEEWKQDREAAEKQDDLRFDELTKEHKTTADLIVKLKNDFTKANTATRAKIAPQTKEKAEELFQTIDVIHQQMERLNTFDSMNGKPYFVENLYAKVKTVYDKILADLKVYIKQDNDENATLKKQMEEMQKMMASLLNDNSKTKAELEKLRTERSGGGGSSSGENFGSDKLQNLVDALITHKQHRDFPKFPKDITQYRPFKEQIENWFQVEGAGMSPAAKLQKLQDACIGHPSAYRLTQKYDATDHNFVICLNELDRRFLVVRNLVFEIVEDMINLPSVHGNVGEQLRNIYDVVTPAIANIESLIRKYVVTRNDEEEYYVQELEVKEGMTKAFIAALIYRKLDDATRTQIAAKLELTSGDMPDPAQMLNVIETKFINLQNVKPPSAPQMKQATRAAVAKTVQHSPRQDKKVRKCLFCSKEGHIAPACRSLLGIQNLSERFQRIKALKLCANCLEAPSGACKCYKDAVKTSRCKRCSAMHNDVLHDDNWKPSPRSANVNVMCAYTKVRTNVPILPTAEVRIFAPNGDVLQVRAFLDTGATDTFLTYEAANKLNLLKTDVDVDVHTFCNELGPPVTHQVDLVLAPLDKCLSFRLGCKAYLAETLGGILPSEQIELEIGWDMTNPVPEFADLEYWYPRKIDMILGAVEVNQILKRKHSTYDNGVGVWESEIGFIVMGAVNTTKKHIAASILTEPSSNWNGLDKYFEHELEHDEKEGFVEEFYKSTVKRDKKGYIVKIPWHADNTLGESKKTTVGRIRSMLRRLPESLRKAYVEQCTAMVDAGYMREAPHGKPARNYIANFALETKSITTPLRILYTCDQKTSNGKSVNDIQYKGPKLQTDLPQCVYRFRFRKIAVAADISKMFLQMRLDAEDAAYQHTFIGEDPDGPLKEMQLTTVIFGMKSSPFLAIRTLLQLAEDEEKQNPLGSQVLRENFYVDDMLASFNSEEQAVATIKQLVNATEKSHFHLRKWASSHEKVLENIPHADKIDAVTLVIKDDKESQPTGEQKIFGMCWNKNSDVLHYNIKVERVEHPTKKSAVSTVARIYDPTGFLAPALMVGKLQIQEIWKNTGKSAEGEDHNKKRQTKDEWDAPIGDKLAEEVKTWQGELKILETIKVPRWMQHAPDRDEMIIGFADASTVAYGCVAYWRSVDEHGAVSITLIGARGKVAPLSKNFVPLKKQDELTLPRLELMAAKLLAEFLQGIKTALKLDRNFPTLAYSDSQITLAWIHGDESRWNTFVANRVRTIKTAVSAVDWDYVVTDENPADLVSRGVMPSKLTTSKLWFNGPEFIHRQKLERDKKDTNTFDTKLDEKKSFAIVTMIQTSATMTNDFDKIDKWTKTIRVAAYILRMIDRWHHLLNRKADPRIGKIEWFDGLTFQECVEAEKWIIKVYQKQTFKKEMDCFAKGLPVQEGKLQQLAPFVDQDGIMRVGGRLGKATFIPYNERHPIILPRLEVPKNRDEENVKTTSLTKKIISWGHLTTLHGGEMKTLSFLKQRFHIPNARNAVRYIIYRCLVCRIQRPVIYRQLMGNLPTDSLNPVPVFYHTTLDYAGPISIQYSTRGVRRTNDQGQLNSLIYGKAWIVIYVCRVVGAYHIELVNSLTAKACVEAFKRFVSTRGLPATVRSDNATTFVKAKKLIKADEREAYDIAVQAVKDGEREIKEIYATQKVEVGKDVMRWEFNPPLAPDFGGKHEAAVKQVKIHLTKTIGQQKMAYANLMTVLKQIEAVLNSRPLCRAEGTAYDRDLILTPAHYILGRPLTALPEPDYIAVPNLTDRFVIQQRMVQQFWKVYRDQYFGQLQNLPKWTKTEPNIQVGEIVLLKEENTPPTVWRKARVVATIPGSDDLVRVVLTNDAMHKEFKRSIRQLVKLPVVIGREGAAEAAGKTPSLPMMPPSKPKAPEPPLVQTQDPQKVNEEVELNPTPKNNKKKQKRKKKTPESKSQHTDVEEPGPSTNDAPIPLRRSARTRTPKVPFYFLLLCLLALGVPTAAEQLNGLMVFQETNILMKTGTHHVKFESNLHPQENINQIQKRVAEYHDQCDKATAGLKTVSCRAEANNLRRTAERTIDEINGLMESSPQSRIKRNANKGAMQKIWEWLVGSDEVADDLTSAKSMGVLTHAVTSFKDIEQKLQSRESHLEDEMVRLTNGVNGELGKIFGFANEAYVTSALMSVYQLILNQIENVERTYMQLDQVMLTDEDVTKIITQIQLQVEGGHVPSVTRQQLNKLMTVEKKITADAASVIIGIPIVLRDVFHKYFVTPLPRNGSDEIPDVRTQTVIVSQRLQQYVSDVALTKINETLAMTVDTVNTFKTLTEQSDCVIATILTQKGSCPVKKLPEFYDEWIETPLHNTVAFYSNQRKEIICKESRERIEFDAGIVKLRRGCHIETPTCVIRASDDMNAIRRHIFDIDVQPAADPINGTIDTTLTHKNLTLDTPADMIDDTELDAVLKDAVSAVQELSTFSVVLITVACCSVVTMGIVIAVLCWTLKRRRQQGQPDQVDKNDEIELRSVYQETPPAQRK